MKLTTIIIIILILPLVAAECFVYEGSDLHCTDITKNQAQAECNKLELCKMETSFLAQTCKETVGCETEININIIVGVIAIISLLASLYFAFKAGLFDKIINWFHKPLPRTPQGLTGIWKLLDPNNVRQPYLEKIKRKRQHKIKDQERKKFFHDIGLELPEKPNDEFAKLARVYRFYEKHKKKISNQLTTKEKQVFSNLEQLIEHSKNTFNDTQNQEVENVIEELRKIAQK